MAERCGVAVRSQRNYELGERSPDVEYLAAVAALGVNLLYLVTGEGNNRASSLDEAEQALLASYRRCKPVARIELLQKAAVLAAGLSEQEADRPGGKVGNIGAGSMVMTNLGDGNVQIGGAKEMRRPLGVKKDK